MARSLQPTTASTKPTPLLVFFPFVFCPGKKDSDDDKEIDGNNKENDDGDEENDDNDSST